MIEVLLPYGMVLGGLLLLTIGGDRLIAAAVELAMRFKVSPLFIGITVVAAGTSLPELLVSLLAQFEGKSGLSIGNVIGSNIFNIGLVLGPVLIWTRREPISPGRVETLALLTGTALLTFFLYYQQDSGGITVLGRGTGFLMESVFVLLLLFTLKSGRKTPVVEEVEAMATGASAMNIFISMVIGVIGLWVGAELLVNGAVQIAAAMGASDEVIGLTIVAAGTGAPELFASIAALRKGSASMAVGNVVGSNLFNTIAIVGAASIVSPLEVNFRRLETDLALSLILTLGVCLLLSTNRTPGFRRGLGIAFLLSYLLWMVSLVS